jgi:hypothetical protein
MTFTKSINVKSNDVHKLRNPVKHIGRTELFSRLNLNNLLTLLPKP